MYIANFTEKLRQYIVRQDTNIFMLSGNARKLYDLMPMPAINVPKHRFSIGLARK